MDPKKPEETYKKAMKLVSRGRCRAAIVLLTNAAANGHFPSRAELANLLIWGRIDVEKDSKKAYWWLHGPGDIVIDDPDCKGMAAYCMYHDNGTKFPKTNAALVEITDNLKQIWDLIDQSCKGNSKFGFFMMGELHREARFDYFRRICHIEEDKCEALKFYGKASEMGCDLASYEAGKIYSFTQGFINLPKAINYLEIAAFQGNVKAIDYLASRHYENHEFIKFAVACQYLLPLVNLPKCRELYEAMLMGCGVPREEPLPAEKITNFKQSDYLIIDINNAAKGDNDLLLSKFLRKLYSDNPRLGGVAIGCYPSPENTFASLLDGIAELEKKLYNREGVKEGPGPDLTIANRLRDQTASILRNREEVLKQNVTDLMAIMNGTEIEREAVAKLVTDRQANLSEHEKKIYVFTADGNDELGYDSIYNAVNDAVKAGIQVISVVSCDRQEANRKYRNIREPNYKLITLTEFIKSIYPHHNFGETVLNLPEYNPSISLTEAMDVMAFDDNIKGKRNSTNRQLLSKVISHMRWKDHLNELLLENGICSTDTIRLQNYDLEVLQDCFVKDLDNDIQTIAVIEYLLQLIKTLNGEQIDDYVVDQPILAYSAKHQLWFPAKVLNVEKSGEKTTYLIQFNGLEEIYEFESKNILPINRESKYAAALGLLGADAKSAAALESSGADAKSAAALESSGADADDVPDVPLPVVGPAPAPASAPVKAARGGPAGAVVSETEGYDKTEPKVRAQADGRFSGKVTMRGSNYLQIQLDGEKTKRKYKNKDMEKIKVFKKEEKVLVSIGQNEKGEFIITNLEKNPAGGSIEDIYKKKYLKYKNKYIQLKLHFQ